LKFAGVVPVYRSIDGARGDQNALAFATCHRILAQGGVVAVFHHGHLRSPYGGVSRL
jgi:hypothetical protein